MKSILVQISFFVLSLNVSFAQKSQVKVEGEVKKWHKITLHFYGKDLGEYDEENPFLNYRLNVTFTHKKKVYVVPGFYAADGNAAETSAQSGNVWQVRFRPDEIGEWKYEVSFRKGREIAVNDDPTAGNVVDFDGIKGSFVVEPSDKEGEDFRAKGRLQYTPNGYLQFIGTKQYFLKGGADSPENFLGYYEFDNTPASHKFEPHQKDWNLGDPSWQGGKGKNIIGALNYLASKKMNSVYFLTMNVQGDGKDVWPWNNNNERYRFDCSKLDQWEIVFDHMDRLGLMLHIVTQETENELLLDIGSLGIQRKLYYRELIARFSHHLALTWNLGEENGPVHWSPKGQSDEDRKTMAAYIKKTDPYKNFIALHTHSIQQEQKQFLTPMLGNTNLDGPSMQIHHPNEVHEVTKYWVSKSREHGRKWVICQDEIGPADTGAMPDSEDEDHFEMRSKVLWANLMAGGAGVEWYFGYKYDHNDLNCEDWRSRDKLWEQTHFTLDFFQKHLPFYEMESADELTKNKDDYVFAQNASIYAVYVPEVVETFINLYGNTKTFTVHWYDPKNGGDLQVGTQKIIKGGGMTSIGLPPDNTGDWVALIKVLKTEKASEKRTFNKVVLQALNDFDTEFSQSKAKYYHDEQNNAVAINTEDKDQRNGFARAVAIFPGEKGMYNTIFTSIAENGGESKYILKVNGTIRDSFTNPEIDKSFKTLHFNLNTWFLNKGDIIEISSVADTNKRISEKGGTAWSRGRWSQIEFIPVDLSIDVQMKGTIPFNEANGLVSVEAEEYHYNFSNGKKRNWYIRSEHHVLKLEDDKEESHYHDAGAGAYIEALPDTRITHDDPLVQGENFYPVPGEGGIVGYKVNITTPGRYFVWARAFSMGTEDNGVHVGIDGVWPESGARLQWCEGKNEWTWSSAQRVPENHCGTNNTIYLDIETPGEHIVMFSMREDGFEMDKWLMTTDANFAPE